ncbi:MAG: septum formation initiator family protein [Clostridiales bacterium]|nr:septum formation initiator family protein [Clostridiales bacterium]
MKKKKSRFLPRILMVATLGLLIYGAVQFIRCWNQLEALADYKNELAGQLDEIRDKNDELMREIEFSKTPDFIERIAREIFGWVKPGEIKFVEEEAGGGK